MTCSHRIVGWTAHSFGSSALKREHPPGPVHTSPSLKKNRCLMSAGQKISLVSVCLCLLFLGLFFLSSLPLSLLPCLRLFLFFRIISWFSVSKYFPNTQTQIGTCDGHRTSCCSVPLSYLLCADNSLSTQTRKECLHPHLTLKVLTVGKPLHQAALFANMNGRIWEL